ncbi:LytR C-terminal domain-containing protein [Geodermatophilus sp. SYSU D00703]
MPTPDHGTGEPAAPAGWPDRDTGRDRWSATALSAPTGHPADAAPAADPAREPAPAAGHGDAAPGYRDWTSPSRSKDAPPPATEAIPDRNPARDAGSRTPAPATEAIPDRAPAHGRVADLDEDFEDGPVEDDLEDDLDRDEDAPEPVRGPVTGPSTGVVGGRAAFRAERQAAEVERRKEARRNGVSPVPYLEDDDAGRRPSPVSRAATGLLAVAVVALVVLGVYSFAGSDAQEASTSQDTTAAPTSTAVAAPSSALPPLEIDPLPPAEEAPSTPVRVPVTVLNATGVTGLAAEVAAALEEEGWQSQGVGQYQGGDVAVTTVYVTEDDEEQQQAALQMMEQFPEITGPAVRFFEVPDVADPGLVVVTTGEWRP